MVCSGQAEICSAHKFVQLHTWPAFQGDDDAACEHIGRKRKRLPREDGQK
jgi:hypothetical protein